MPPPAPHTPPPEASEGAATDTTDATPTPMICQLGAQHTTAAVISTWHDRHGDKTPSVQHLVMVINMSRPCLLQLAHVHPRSPGGRLSHCSPVRSSIAQGQGLTFTTVQRSATRCNHTFTLSSCGRWLRTTAARHLVETLGLAGMRKKPAKTCSSSAEPADLFLTYNNCRWPSRWPFVHKFGAEQCASGLSVPR